MSFEIDIVRQVGSQTVKARFAAGEGITALFGPSGIGKTSVLNMIAGLLRPDKGRIVVNGQTLFDDKEQIDLPPEQRRVGYIFQDARLFPHKRVRANLLFGYDLVPASARWMTLEEATSFLGIDHLLGRWPRSLSGGEERRVAIGRALLCGPHFLMMDEPLSFLDTERREDIMTVIERIRDEVQIPILYVSHDRQEIDRLANRVVSLG